MKVCVVGAGAMGGYIGALLAKTGVDVSLIARGPHLAAMQENGLRLTMEAGDEIHVHPFCTDDPAKAGHQDYVFIALKAHSVPPMVERIKPLLGPNTTVVTAVNGIPWWYFYKHGAHLEGKRLHTVDPGDKQWDGIGPERALGTVLWPACEVLAPGVIQHQHGDRIPIGEPDGSRSPRAEALSKAMIAAGLKSPVRPRIREEIWMKLWGNLSFNPVSALTHGTLEEIARHPVVKPVIERMMEESRAIGEKLGVRFSMSVPDRIATAEKVGAHKTSMLQDLEAGRPMEIDALVSVVSELGRLTETPTPTIDTVLALVIQRAQKAGCYGA